ncbi:MAG: hypothetical protein KAT69_01710 [Candidatus Aminicenantes bacterium]|nr:hypothetical protein [Candidatus Aminicenantes bacterium]
MPDNNQNIPITTGGWVDLYTLTGITVGEPLHIKNIGVSDIFLAVQATKPDNDHKAYDVIERNDDIAVTNNSGDSGAWAFSNATKGLLSVASTADEGFWPALKVFLMDGFGNPIGSLGGAIDTHKADVHNIPVNDYVHRHVSPTTLVAAVTAGDIQIQVADATGFVVGEYVHMGPIGNTKEPIHPQVTVQDIPGGIVTLDRPIDFSYANGEDVSVAIVNMVTGSVGATLAAPVVYRYLPHNGQVEHIERLLFSMVHNTAADDSKFGGEAALANGIVLRAFINGQYGTFTNWKTNSDIKLDMFDVEYTDKAGGGDFGTNGRGSFNRIGVVIKLDPAQGDFVEFLVQDPQDILSLKIKMQGHVEGG